MKPIRLVAIALLMALAAAACGTPQATTGTANKGTVKVGGIFDLTGGTADVGVPYADGVRDAVEYINGKNLAGGWQLRLIGHDYAYKVPQALELYTKLTTQDNVPVIMGWGTGDTAAMAPKIAIDKIPFMSASYAEELTDTQKFPYNFMIGVTYSDQMRIALQYVLDHPLEASRKPRVAFLYNDSGFGKAPLPAGRDFARAHGIEVVDEEIIALTALDATSQLLKMKQKDPDYAIIQQTANATATIIKDAKRLGLRTKLIGLNWATDENVVTKADAAAAEGYLGTSPFAFPAEKAPGMQEMRDFNKKKGKDLDTLGIRYVQGWITMRVMAEGIARAGDKITGESVKAGLEKLKDYSTNGITAPLTFTSTRHKGALKLKLYQVKNGAWTAVSDYIQAKE